MASIYQKADIYDLLEDREHIEIYKRHWAALVKDKGIHSFLDVSIGSGSVTLPLAEMGIEVSGSDLSEEMLEKCKGKAQNAGYNMNLKCSDFRDLSCWEGKEFDCVASTGNSLPHVQNMDVLKALEQMDSLVKDNGYLYLDMRNWEKILHDRNRFFLYNPVFIGEDRVNLIQVWDYHADDSMTFNLLYTFEKNNQIFQKEEFEETYYPIKREMIIDKLKSLGYTEINIQCFPACFSMPEFERVEWYCIMAKKH